MTINSDNEIVEKFRKRCKEFITYFEGYVRHSTTPIRRLANLFSDLEKIVFGEIKTKSWA